MLYIVTVIGPICKDNTVNGSKAIDTIESKYMALTSFIQLAARKNLRMTYGPAATRGVGAYLFSACWTFFLTDS